MADGVELATAWVRLVPSVEGIQGTITKEFGAADSGLEKAGDKAGKKWSAGAKAAATAGAAVLVGAVVSVFNTGLEELKFGEQISTQTDTLIKNTGFAMATSEIEDYTLALSQVSGVSEEDLQSAGNDLLKFGGLSEDAYKQAVSSINDIASTGKDAASVSQSLGKALADPAAAAGILRKQGIALTEEQKKLIDGFVAVGDTAGAQGVVLDALEGTYGGMAEASGDTLQGNLNKLNNAWENLAGAAVETLMPAIEGVVGMLQGFVTWISENEGLVQVLVIGLGILAAAWVAVTVAMWAASLTPIVLIIGAIVIGVGLLVAAIIWLVQNWDAVWATITTIAAGFFTWIGTVITGFVEWWNGVWGAVGAFIADVWNNIVSWITGAVNYVAAFIAMVVDGIRATWENTWTGIGDFLKDVWNNILSWIEGGVNGAIDLINGMLGGIKDVAGFIGIEVGTIPHVNLPRLADGATILPRPGGTAAILAEAGRPESVVDTGLMNRALEQGLKGSGGGGERVRVDATFQQMDPATAIRLMSEDIAFAVEGP